jgi:hypothetical protein
MMEEQWKALVEALKKEPSTLTEIASTVIGVDSTREK